MLHARREICEIVCIPEHFLGNRGVMKTIDGSSQAPGTGKPIPMFRAPGVLFAV
jgi:hypothetical protein